MPACRFKFELFKNNYKQVKYLQACRFKFELFKIIAKHAFVKELQNFP
jgi:hypothetical protein